jgi:8-oxo-dGTP pyrophosphatase MutT (NUDIX family)
MADEHLSERCIGREQLVKGGFLDVRRDTVQLPDGHVTTREYIVHPGAVVIVPLLDDGRLVLERQHRYPLDRVLLEFPAGKIDPGEPPFACIVRELAEETGYRAREWARAGVPPAVGFFGKLAVLQALVATNLPGYSWLAVIAVLLSLIGAFYYLRVVKVMYFDEPAENVGVPLSRGVGVLLALNGALVLVLGIVPGGLMALCADAIVKTLAT